MPILSAFIDESGTDRHSNVLYVGGYLFDEEGERSFISQWTETWRPFKDRGFDAFHATDWANRNSRFFQATTDKERETLFTDLIETIRATAKFGAITSLTEETYRASTNKNISSSLTGSKYTSCAFRTLFLLSGLPKGEEEKIRYHFESGNEFAGETDHMMNLAEKNPSVLQRLRYDDHRFCSKSSLIHLQAADALLWLWNRHQKNDHYDWLLNRLRGPGGVPTYVQEVTELSLDFLAIHNDSAGIISNRKHPKPQGRTRIFRM